MTPKLTEAGGAVFCGMAFNPNLASGRLLSHADASLSGIPGACCRVSCFMGLRAFC